MAQVLERESVRRTVVAAVLALDPLYRDTLLFRYFDNLPPREVARRLGVPVETALKPAVERQPKHAASSAPFLAEENPAMREAVAKEDDALFEAGMDRFRSACTKTYAMEQSQWFVLEMPERRASPIRTLH